MGERNLQLDLDAGVIRQIIDRARAAGLENDGSHERQSQSHSPFIASSVVFDLIIRLPDIPEFVGVYHRSVVGNDNLDRFGIKLFDTHPYHWNPGGMELPRVFKQLRNNDRRTLFRNTQDLIVKGFIARYKQRCIGRVARIPLSDLDEGTDFAPHVPFHQCGRIRILENIVDSRL